jgi:hypothetical protein
MKDEEKPPAQMLIDWNAPDSGEPTLELGEFTNPDDLELALSSTPGHDGLVLYFPRAHQGLIFRDGAMKKLLYLFDVLLHHLLNSDSAEAHGEGPRGKTKKVTLH